MSKIFIASLGLASIQAGNASLTAAELEITNCVQEFVICPSGTEPVKDNEG